MRLGRFKAGDRVFIGAVRGDVVVDLEKTAATREGFLKDKPDFSEMNSMLTRLDDLAALLKGDHESRVVHPLSGLKILPPLTAPDKIICIGLNYNEHAVESEMELPEEPVFFCKFKSSIIGPEAPIMIPKVSNQVDYEAELAVIIGKRGKHIPEEEAMEHVAGYTCFNDVSARDLQFRGGQWIKGKALDTFAPLGPYIVTKDEVSDPHNLKIGLELNGRMMQDSSTDKLIFNIPRLIAFLSQLFTLEAGDIVATGTPSGVGFTRQPPVFLKPGDVVKVIVEQVGELVNPVVAEA
ncbi:MAG: fumarylacetoacetate hydrolase family protein [Firmicutes bacterium]|nr:fumarylacetoacetate hydrolase family protein [Bacillota bacterium]